MPVDPIAAAGFGSSADLYERARPSYPAAVVDWIAERAGLHPGTTVVDLGAGTGKLTRALATTGARVIAVEPLPEMRAKLLEMMPGVEAIDGTAESLPLPDATADAITVAQAFHWFDLDVALSEIHRVLRPGGLLVLIWNSRDLDDPLQRGIEELLAPLRAEVPVQQLGVWRPPLDASPLFGPLEERVFDHARRATTDEICETIATRSYVAVLSPIDREELLARVRALTYGLDEPFPFGYVTEAYVARRL